MTWYKTRADCLRRLLLNNIMAEVDEDGLPIVNVGDRVKLVDGQRGTVRAISGKGDHCAFNLYQVELASSKIVTEPRYKFDVIPSCPGADPAVSCQVIAESSVVSDSTCRPNKQSFVTQNMSCDGCNQPNKLLGTPSEGDVFGTSDDSLDDFDIDRFINNETNRNTRKKTDSDVGKVFDYFQNKLKEKRPIESIPPIHLNRLLCVFFMNVRNNKGDEYEPSTIRGIQCSIDRYLKLKNYGKQIATSSEFAKVMDVIRCKQKKLKREGKGNQPKKAEAISDTDIDKLYQTGQLGAKNPETLLRTVWLQNTVHFGMRGVTEHRDMKWGDVKLCQDTDGNEFIEFNERQTKTRQGSNPTKYTGCPSPGLGYPCQCYSLPCR